MEPALGRRVKEVDERRSDQVFEAMLNLRRGIESECPKGGGSERESNPPSRPKGRDHRI